MSNIEHHGVSDSPALFNVLNQEFTQDLSVRTADSRRKYLELLKSGNTPHALIVSGLPGAGKTFLYDVIAKDPQFKYEPAERFMPRSNRPSDTKGDKPWPLAHQGLNDTESFGPESVVFANHKYQGYYGFSGKGLLNQFQQHKTPVMFVTSFSELVPLAEGINNVLPLLPVITLRIEVPHEILPARINGRAEAHSGESIQRIQQLQELASADFMQTRSLHEVYDMRVIWNLTEQEINSHGFSLSQITPTTEEGIQGILHDAREKIVRRSQAQATDILKERPLVYGNPLIPDSLIEVLDQVLLPTASTHCSEDLGSQNESPIILKAGLAAAIYLGKRARVVSPDIDFTLPHQSDAGKTLELLMEQLNSGAPVIWDDGWSKDIYHCRGIKGAAIASNGQEVELDALHLTRVQPVKDGFVFSFAHDAHDMFFRRTVTTPSGFSVPLVPPEQLAIEKLVAGRGPEIDKFDLFDAAGLIALYDFNPHLLRKIFESQQFDKDLDSTVQEALTRTDFSLTEDTLIKIGLKTVEMRQIALYLATPIPDEQRKLPDPGRRLTMTALKQLAFLDAVYRSLDKIEQELELETYPLFHEKLTIAERFGKDEVLAGVARLRSQVLLHAGHYVGIGDHFVNRQHDNENYKAGFFSELDDQRKRLQFFLPND